MIKLFLIGFAAAVPLTANAQLGIGAIGSYHLSDHYSLSNPEGPESVSPKSSYAVGGLVYFSLVPSLETRIGLEYEKMMLNDSLAATTNRYTYENLLIPIDAQFSLPVKNLYVFGGGIGTINYHAPSNTPMHPDLRLNAGAGYTVLTLPLMSLGVEAEYMMGLLNISPVPGHSVKTNTLTINLVGRFDL